MIDKNGKLFGKINIIDLLIVLVVIAAVILVATKMFTPAEKAAKLESSNVIVTYTSSNAYPGSGAAIEVGAPVYEETTNIQLGTVKDVKVEQAYTYQALPDGTTVKVITPGREWVTVTTEVEATVSDDGVFIGGSPFSVGGTATVPFGQAVILVSVMDIESAS